jgi:hypothetical protein
MHHNTNIVDICMLPHNEYGFYATTYYWNLIKVSLTPSILPGFYSWLVRESPPTWYQSRGLKFNFIGHAFPFNARNNFHLSCYLLNTHLAWVLNRDSHVGGRMLDYNIRGSLTAFISPVFYDWTDWGGYSSMVSKSGDLEFESQPCIFYCV